MERPNGHWSENDSNDPNDADPRRDSEPGQSNPDLGPPQEQLEPGEIDLTGVIGQPSDLGDVIFDAITEAKLAGGEVPEWGARAMARLLANHQASRSSALHQFAATGQANLEQMSTEISDLWDDSPLPATVAESINWLGTYLLGIARAAREQLDSPQRPETRPDIRPDMAAGIAEHGPAFAAFLRLPDIETDITLGEALRLFAEVSAGSYDSLDDLVVDVAETLGLDQLLDEALLSHIASVDPAKVLVMARENWDIVAFNGRFYLFVK